MPDMNSALIFETLVATQVADESKLSDAIARRRSKNMVLSERYGPDDAGWVWRRITYGPVRGANAYDVKVFMQRVGIQFHISKEHNRTTKVELEADATHIDENGGGEDEPPGLIIMTN